MIPAKILPVVFVFLLAGGVAAAQVKYTYVDAKIGRRGNTTLANGKKLSIPTNGNTGVDNNWEERTEFASSGNVFEAAGEFIGKGGEDAPEIRTCISDLKAGATYKIYVHFWTAASPEKWSIRAGFASAPGENKLFGPADIANPSESSVSPARNLTYAVAPTVFNEGNREMLAGFVGTAKADKWGRIYVYIDDLPNTTGNPEWRTWYDGLSYALAPDPEPK